ncbi:hypothetical protein MHOL44478_14985 [Mycobacterium holsaticum DSM 44478]|nr:hypothetical protein [Mycolicibacterium holsaticum DSM 44478 = JCM 12374]
MSAYRSVKSVTGNSTQFLTGVKNCVPIAMHRLGQGGGASSDVVGHGVYDSCGPNLASP